jgi:uncharacterized protein (TIGR03086 family)
MTMTETGGRAAVLVAALEQAIDGFADRLARVGPGDWSRSTPCPAWDVRALVNHVLGANVRYRLLLGGASVDEVEATREADHLRDDPVATFRATSARLVEDLRSPGALDRT